ncbi:TPM domain-containing protein [Chitinophaga sp. 30R24]|uniref:TPM domain-containing protein n=1 Tax=Chitinophaga sp. 30R24 TaxID=3248838 RepID=UPI003B91B307
MHIRKTIFAAFVSGMMISSLAAAAQTGGLQSLVTDRADVLKPATEETLLKQLQQEEKESGVKIYVLTVKTFDQKEIDQLVEGAGKIPISKGKKGGSVLLVASPGSKKIKIVVSDELEGRLTNDLCTQLIKSEIVPSLKKGDYDTGLRAGVNALQKALKGNYVSRD